ncbi:MAG TPA: hypothetical protein VGE43_12875, partial [Acidimicrobiales bacterium]
MRRTLTALLLPMLLLAAACGDDDAGADQRAESPAAAETAAEETGTEDVEGQRTVEHAMGTTEVPAEPERVVVLDSSFLD